MEKKRVKKTPKQEVSHPVGSIDLQLKDWILKNLKTKLENMMEAMREYHGTYRHWSSSQTDRFRNKT